MAAVSPCFFAHYGTEPPWGWNKNFIYASDKNLYATRWEDILSFKPDMVQIISWNDFGESHCESQILPSTPILCSTLIEWTRSRRHRSCRRLAAGLRELDGWYGSLWVA
jgi:glucan endo-1,3-alpha-glucosidase